MKYFKLYISYLLVKKLRAWIGWAVRGKIEKTSTLTQFSIRAILSHVYIQLDARPIEEDYEKIVS